MGVEINVGTTWPIFNTITSLCAYVFYQQLMVVCLLAYFCKELHGEVNVHQFGSWICVVTLVHDFIYVVLF